MHLAVRVASVERPVHAKKRSYSAPMCVAVHDNPRNLQVATQLLICRWLQMYARSNHLHDTWCKVPLQSLQPTGSAKRHHIIRRLIRTPRLYKKTALTSVREPVTRSGAAALVQLNTSTYCSVTLPVTSMEVLWQSRSSTP